MLRHDFTSKQILGRATPDFANYPGLPHVYAITWPLLARRESSSVWSLYRFKDFVYFWLHVQRNVSVDFAQSTGAKAKKAANSAIRRASFRDPVRLLAPWQSKSCQQGRGESRIARDLHDTLVRRLFPRIIPGLGTSVKWTVR
jgi:Signal transduction histidine kinase